MKKLLKFLPMLLLAVLAVGLTACDDKDEPINPDKLPQKAKIFIENYYPSAEVLYSRKDKDSYDVTLANGHQLEFNKKGDWKDVDAPMGLVIPQGFYPAAIDAYVYGNEAYTGINEIEKVKNGYEVETVSGIELRFDKNGNFTGFGD